MDGLAVLGMPGLPVTDGFAVLGTLGLAGPVPRLPDPGPMLLLPAILPAAPVPPLPPVPPTWAKARVEMRQSTDSDAAHVFANFQTMGYLPV